jgi:hypothetical protein
LGRLQSHGEVNRSVLEDAGRTLYIVRVDSFSGLASDQFGTGRGKSPKGAVDTGLGGDYIAVTAGAAEARQGAGSKGP